MGVHISKVRSLTLDAWENEALAMLNASTNDEFNALWECQETIDMLNQSQSESGEVIAKPQPNATRDAKER